MTVTSTTAISGPYDGNDVTVTFDYTFYIADEDELKVTLTDEDGVDTVQTITTHYTVSISDDGTGTFTMVTAPATGEQVTATLDVDLTQETDLLNLGQFAAETHETMADKLTRICQQQQEVLDRCLKLGQSSDLDPEDVTLANLATQVIIDTDNFANVLTSADDTLQEALETIDGGFGARVRILLDSSTASGAANITVNSADVEDYDLLLLQIIGLYGASSAVPRLYFTDTGGTPIGTTSLRHCGYGYDVTGSERRWNSASGVAYAELVNANLPPAAADALYGELTLFKINSSLYSQFHGNLSWHDLFDATANIFGGRTTQETLGGVQIVMSTGNIYGTLRLWGLPTGS